MDSLINTNNNGSGNAWLVNLKQWFHPLVTLGLLITTVLLFLQLQYVASKISEEETRVDELLERVQNQQQGQIQELSEKVEDNHNLTLYQMAGTFTLLTSLLTMFHMTAHLRKFTEPSIQRKVVTILWMSPIYAATSFLSLVFPSADGYLAVIRDFYEAYVIYTFLSFLIAVLGRGDRNTAVDVLAQHADHLEMPTKLLSRWYSESPEASNRAKANAVLTECQILCMQFVFCRPFTSIAGFVAYTIASEKDSSDSSDWSYFWSPQFFISMITNVSVFLAFTGLLKFYHAIQEELMWCQPFSKFMAIKGVVFLTFWQGLLITIVVSLNYEGSSSSTSFSNSANMTMIMNTNSTVNVEPTTESGGKTAHQQAADIQNVLICFEMLFFSIAHWCVFPSEEWESGYRPQKLAKPSMGFGDFVQDVGTLMGSTRGATKRHREKQENDLDNQLALEEGTEEEQPTLYKDH